MFSDEKADRATKFIEDQLTHGIGHHAGTPFLLRDWQRKIIRDIFGNVDEDGNRLIKTVYIEIPKKNGKSSLAAAVALKLLYADRERSAEIYGAAADRIRLQSYSTWPPRWCGAIPCCSGAPR